MINNIECCVCGKGKLKTLANFKKFPITGIFIKKFFSKNKKYDLKIGICNICSHLQLKRIVPKNILYNSKYYNRTGKSHLSMQAYGFFKKFIFKTLKKKKLGNLLEIGCNDITMLKKFSKYCKIAFGIDPIWRGKKNKFKKLKLLGKFIENVNFKKDINFIPDTVISTHNFEHIEDPFKMLKKLSSVINKDSTVFIEVPDGKTMIDNLRFDQIFHQHYHYFTLNSLKNIARRANLEVKSYSLNKKFWGGSLMVAMRKTNKINKKIIKSKKVEKKFRKNLNLFKKKYVSLSKKINSSESIIGYGAGQMTPTFAYHLKSNFRKIKYILDDDKSKNQHFYPELKPQIIYANKIKFDENKYYLITALDGVVPIKAKLKNLNIKKIISI